jgi:hypothetical protein
MEPVKLTYLEVLELLDGGAKLFSLDNNLVTNTSAADLFFLREDEPLEMYIYNEYN